MTLIVLVAYWVLVYSAIAVFWAFVPKRWRHFKSYVWPIDMLTILLLGPANRDILIN